jgi:hypothetical protein
MMPWFPGMRKNFSPCRTVAAAVPIVRQTDSRVTTHLEQIASVSWPHGYNATGVRSGDCDGHKNIPCPLVIGDYQPVSNGEQDIYMSLDSRTVADTFRLKRNTTDKLSHCYSPSNNPVYPVFNVFGEEETEGFTRQWLGAHGWTPRILQMPRSCTTLP